MFILFLIILLILFMSGCHCPTPVGFCAHDIQYLLLGVPFLWPLRMKIQNFHWWRHKKCRHHPVGEVCKSHDHTKEELDVEACFKKELDEIGQLINDNTKSGQEMSQYWEKERSKIS